MSKEPNNKVMEEAKEPGHSSSRPGARVKAAPASVQVEVIAILEAQPEATVASQTIQWLGMNLTEWVHKTLYTKKLQNIAKRK